MHVQQTPPKYYYFMYRPTLKPVAAPGTCAWAKTGLKGFITLGRASRGFIGLHTASEGAIGLHSSPFDSIGLHWAP